MSTALSVCRPRQFSMCLQRRNKRRGQVSCGTAGLALAFDTERPGLPPGLWASVSPPGWWRAHPLPGMVGVRAHAPARKAPLFRHLKTSLPVGLGDVAPICPLAFVGFPKDSSCPGLPVAKPHPPQGAPGSRQTNPPGVRESREGQWRARGRTRVTRGGGEAGRPGAQPRLHLCDLSSQGLQAGARTSRGLPCLRV